MLSGEFCDLLKDINYLESKNVDIIRLGIAYEVSEVFSGFFLLPENNIYMTILFERIVNIYINSNLQTTCICNCFYDAITYEFIFILKTLLEENPNYLEENSFIDSFILQSFKKILMYSDDEILNYRNIFIDEDEIIDSFPKIIDILEEYNVQFC